jgi:hypothetical protein
LLGGKPLLRDDALEPAFVPSPAGSPDSPAAAAGPVPAWSPAKRISFRFAFSYLVLYILPFPIYVIPYLQVITKPYEELWNALVPWVGRHVFHVNITVFPNGSGDTTFNYVQLFCFLVLAVVATLVWTLLDRRRTQYERLYEWLRVYVRFDLAVTMFAYGIDKVIMLQFQSPGPDRLLEPFGQASPMGLLWTFMGASAAYTFFGGASEVLGGLLLTTRRTTLLGSLVCIGVITNIVMLNFSYDVPVKLFSSHLLLMAVFLAAPDVRRLADLFVLNRPVPAARVRPLFSRRWAHLGTLILRTVLLVAFLVSSFYDALAARKTYGELAPKPPLYGIWNVDELVENGQIRPPLLTDQTRWQRLIFAYPGYVRIQPMATVGEKSSTFYAVAVDEKARTLTLTKGGKGKDTGKDKGKPAWKAVLAYTRPDPSHLVLDGTFDGRQIHAVCQQADASQFLLVNRGFHWINEYPMNR